ncbi:MAG: VOC family protein [Thioalkalispiraceae bacterium]|jgi:lactoylglutathione lyase
MKTIKGLDHIGIRVTDFKRAVGFYEQLGFEIVRMDLKERIIVLLHKSGVVLNLLDSAIKIHRVRNVLMDETIKYAGYTHIAFRVTDIEQAIQYIRMLELTITEGPVTFGDGKTSIFIRDPDRNVIEFTQPLLEHATQSDVLKQGSLETIE